MRIGISLNEVVRDLNDQFIRVYKKYVNSELEIKVDDITDEDSSKFLEFENKIMYNKFRYELVSLEIFGHADIVSDNIITLFNQFMIDLKFNNDSEEDVEFVIISDEVNKGIPGTLFFLSKSGVKVKEYKFDNDPKELVDNLDALISATPSIINACEGNVYTVKINTPYNKEVESDDNYDSLEEYVTNGDNVNNMLNKIKKVK